MHRALPFPLSFRHSLFIATQPPLFTQRGKGNGSKSAIPEVQHTATREPSAKHSPLRSALCCVSDRLPSTPPRDYGTSYTNLVLPLPREHRVGLCDEQAAHRCSLLLQRGEHLCKDPRSQAGGTQTIQARKVGSQHSCPKKPEVLGPDVIDMHV